MLFLATYSPPGQISMSTVLLLLTVLCGGDALQVRQLRAEIQTDNSTNTTTTPLVSKLHASLVFPVAKKVPIQHLTESEFVNQYCATASVSKAIASVGSSSVRYWTAVQDKMKKILAPPLVLNVTLPTISSSPPTALQTLYGSCSRDSDCASLDRRKYCLEGICRECVQGSFQSDCPSSSADPEAGTCAKETGYTCSDCMSDSDCGGGFGACRFAFPPIDTVPMMPRKVCTACPFVPVSGEIFNATSCAWRCPWGTSFDGSGECAVSPICSETDYLAPSSEKSEFFFSPGVNATTPVCVDCGRLGPVGGADFCAVLGPNLPGDLNGQNSPSNTSLPCSRFACKPGFHLNEHRSQCVKCDLSVCALGSFLEGCAGESAGACTSCVAPGSMKNATWVDLTRLSNVTDPQIACLTVCAEGFFRGTSDDACISCSEAEARMCRIGQVIEDCGPGSDAGACKSCPPVGPGNYWTGQKCQEAPCSAQVCPPGQTLQGCGGEKSGQCAACPGGLPKGATGWTFECKFNCQVGYFTDGKNSCQECDSALQCKSGQQLLGCGVDGVTPGTCSDCPSLGQGLFYKASTKCKSHRCDSSICKDNQQLVGCGYGEPGKCGSCGTLPTGLHAFTRRSGLDCQPYCDEGFFAIRTGNAFTCKSCSDPGICRPGYYLSNCGIESTAGICEPCDFDELDTGEFWTGENGCTKSQCSAVTCGSDEFLTLCGKESPSGGFGSGECTACKSVKSLPANAVSWTTVKDGEKRTCVPVCSPGFIEDNFACRKCNSEDNCNGKQLTGKTYL